MSAEMLRRAAALMRERAVAATPGPWTAQHVPQSAVANQHIIERWFVMGYFDGNPRNPTGPAAMSEYEPDAAHIASWHPAIALAVADLLDMAATHQVGFTPVARERITAIARPYLGDADA